jgi:hypothetical protein
MKLNFKKMKMNQVVLLISVIVVIAWMVMRSRGRVEYNEGEKSEALLYVENTEEPNAFVLYGMVKKMTDDEEIQKNVLKLATQKKFDEVKTILVTL